jgi:16S rRNA U1498 N3-methylase RsmE
MNFRNRVLHLERHVRHVARRRQMPPLLLVGPEGGPSDQEIEVLTAEAVRDCGLPPLVIRAPCQSGNPT